MFLSPRVFHTLVMHSPSIRKQMHEAFRTPHLTRAHVDAAAVHVARWIQSSPDQATLDARLADLAADAGLRTPRGALPRNEAEFTKALENAGRFATLDGAFDEVRRRNDGTTIRDLRNIAERVQTAAMTQEVVKKAGRERVDHLERARRSVPALSPHAERNDRNEIRMLLDAQLGDDSRHRARRLMEAEEIAGDASPRREIADAMLHHFNTTEYDAGSDQGLRVLEADSLRAEKA